MFSPVRARLTAFALVFALALAPAPARAQVAQCDAIAGSPGFLANGTPVHWALSGSTLQLSFNASLDPALETSFGDAASRRAAFQQAVAEWNAALTNVGATLQIVAVMDDAAWTTEQGYSYCQESPGATDVFVDQRGLRWRDGVNQVSTALNPGDANLDPSSNPLGAGWILPASYPLADTSAGVVPVDKNLASPKLRYDTVDPSLIVEGDFTWFTHVDYQPTGSDEVCVRLPWDYRWPDAPDPARWDFYSVMLHSLGHLLGVGHQGPDAMGTNVMQTSLGKGERRVIGPKELMCLCERYGPGQPACGDPTGAKHPTWGSLKAIYR